jgi:hypothetical protein
MYFPEIAVEEHAFSLAAANDMVFFDKNCSKN